MVRGRRSCIYYSTWVCVMGSLVWVTAACCCCCFIFVISFILDHCCLLLLLLFFLSLNYFFYFSLRRVMVCQLLCFYVFTPVCFSFCSVVFRFKCSKQVVVYQLNWLLVFTFFHSLCILFLCQREYFRVFFCCLFLHCVLSCFEVLWTVRGVWLSPRVPCCSLFVSLCQMEQFRVCSAVCSSFKFSCVQN